MMDSIICLGFFYNIFSSPTPEQVLNMIENYFAALDHYFIILMFKYNWRLATEILLYSVLSVKRSDSAFGTKTIEVLCS